MKPTFKTTINVNICSNNKSMKVFLCLDFKACK